MSQNTRESRITGQLASTINQASKRPLNFHLRKPVYKFAFATKLCRSSFFAMICGTIRTFRTDVSSKCRGPALPTKEGASNPPGGFAGQKWRPAASCAPEAVRYSPPKHRTSMRKVTLILLFFLSCAFTGSAQEKRLDENLQALQPFLGSWRGEFKSSTPEKPVIDVALWERALNGKAVRILHSINDGAYGGETLVTWDAKSKTIVYHYFTTAGFQTKGTMKIDGKKLVCHEVVTGNTEETTEVKSTIELRDENTMHTSAKYFKNGTSEQGREVTYQRVSGSLPVFK